MNRYIAGKNIHEAVARMKTTKFAAIFDYAKEGSSNIVESRKNVMKIINDIKCIPSDAAYALKYSTFNNENLMKNGISHILQYHKPIFLDAEDVKTNKTEARLYNELLDIYNISEVKVYKTYQMYRCHSLTELMNDLRYHKHIGIKLVRGAYYEMDHLSGELFTSKKDTDDNYNEAAKLVIHSMRKNPNIRVVFATHNDESIRRILKTEPLKTQTSFAQLLGMNDSIGYECLSHKYKVYKYAPYGSINETYPYLIRRLYENLGVLKYL